MVSIKDVYEIGEIPPIGTIPRQMYAQVIRQERFGEPRQAFQIEKVDVPALKPDEALILVMAAGVNYNNVWASLGTPVDVIKVHER
ncbi:MAG: crotonyl-CoA carboxylase/reductase, partial [Dehalococcoidia bacterium]